jgi:hypothetical protein
MIRRAIYLSAFVALNAHSFLTMPGWQPDTWNRVAAMATRDFSAVEPAAYAVFVLYGMWSLLLAALILIDGEGRSLRAWPFALSTMVLGPSMVFLYQAFRPGEAATPLARTTLEKIARWPLLGIVIAAITLGALWDGRSGDLDALWTQFQTDYLTHAMLVDEALFLILVPILVAQDRRRAGRGRAWVWVCLALPIFGVCAYLTGRRDAPGLVSSAGAARGGARSD